jgi:hypothetical protein
MRPGPTVNQNGSSYASMIHDKLDIERTLETELHRTSTQIYKTARKVKGKGKVVPVIN